MSKQCIICGNRAGSGEHLFPAALGGRRVCNSIYCKTHNEGFSPLVSILSMQFEAINALLAVRPDRKKGPRVATVEGDSGEQLLLSGAGVALTGGDPSGGVSKISLSGGVADVVESCGGVVSGLFNEPQPAFQRRRRPRHGRE